MWWEAGQFLSPSGWPTKQHSQSGKAKPIFNVANFRVSWGVLVSRYTRSGRGFPLAFGNARLTFRRAGRRWLSCWVKSKQCDSNRDGPPHDPTETTAVSQILQYGGRLIGLFRSYPHVIEQQTLFHSTCRVATFDRSIENAGNQSVDLQTPNNQCRQAIFKRERASEGRNAMSLDRMQRLGRVNSNQVTRRFNIGGDPSCLCIHASAATTRVLVLVGRVLLVLITLSLMTAPLTQHLWTWDQFLHGGQDFEMHTLVILTFFCLVLVLCKHRKWSADLLFESWLTLQCESRVVLLSRTSVYGDISRLRLIPEPAPCSGTCNTPLQI